MVPTKTDRRDQLTIAFAAVTLILLVVAAVGTTNYYRFYPAITQLHVKMASLQTTRFNNTNGVYALAIKVIFTVENPIDYNGLLARNFESTLDIIGMSQTANTTVNEGSLPYIATTGPLSKGNIVSVAFPAYNATGNAVALANQPGTQLQFVFHLNFVLSSFLNKVSTLIANYQCSSTGSATPCLQAGITFQNSGGPSVGGGGGV